MRCYLFTVYDLPSIRWFSNDGVYFDDEHTKTLREHPDLKTVWFQEAEARVPYTPLQATHYVWTGIKV